MSRFVLAVSLLALQAAPALAQKAPASAPASAESPTLGGPVVPGVCLLSQTEVFTDSKVGQAASAQLKTLSDQAQVEIDAERNPIAAENTALNAPDSKLSAADKAAKTAELTARAQALQAKAALLSRELEASRVKATERIGVDLRPLIAKVYAAHKCGLLFDKAVALGGNMGADLTPEVVRALDAKISTITFEREVLPPQ